MPIATALIKPDQLTASHFLETVSAKAAPPEIIKASDTARAAWLGYREASDQVTEAEQDIEHAAAQDLHADRLAEAAGEEYPEPDQALRAARSKLAEAHRRKTARAAALVEAYRHFAGVQAEQHAEWLEAQERASAEAAGEFLETIEAAKSAFVKMTAATAVSGALRHWHGNATSTGALRVMTDADTARMLAQVEHEMSVAREKAARSARNRTASGLVEDKPGTLFAHLQFRSEAAEPNRRPVEEKLSKAAAIEAANVREERLQRRADARGWAA